MGPLHLKKSPPNNSTTGNAIPRMPIARLMVMNDNTAGVSLEFLKFIFDNFKM